jgi:GH24 family phage-related lysozyme (muramidase)
MIQIDWNFIEELEGFRNIGYVPTDAAGKPLGKSGATVGAGVDLGQWSEVQLRQRRVPDVIIEQVRPYLGVRGHDAMEILQHRPLNMSRENASALTECIRNESLDGLVKRYDAASDRPFRYLSQQAQTVIASVAFQYGNLATETPNFWRQVTRRDWKAAHANLMNFGDAYRTRRRKEAAYLADLIG